MKKLLGCVATVLCAGAAMAQIGEVGGGLMVVGDSDHLDTGVGAYVFGAARPVPVFSLRATAAVWDADTDGALMAADRITIAGLEGSAVLHYGKQAERIHLWAGGGVGVYTFDDQEDWHDDPWFDDPGLEYDIEDEFGLHALAGVDMLIFGPFSFYIEGKYLFLESEAEEIDHRQDGVTVTRLGELNFDAPIVNFGFKAVF